ncbi:MAG: ABC transporter permease [Ktedonobacterales bacterium]
MSMRSGPQKTVEKAASAPVAFQRPGFSLRRTFAVSLRIVRQFVRDRRSMALLFLAPLLIMTLLNFVLNSTSTSVALGIVPPPGQTGITLVHQITVQAQNQGGLAIKTVSAGAVDATLKDGDADGVLIFPSDFFTTIATGGTPQLTLRLEGSNPTVAKQLRGLVALLVGSLAHVSGPAAGGEAAVPQVTASYLYGGPQFTQTDALAPLFLGLFAFFFVFLLTSVSFLRERSQGTIERLMVSPLSKAELVLGYVFGFLLFAMLQSLVILLFVLYVLRVHYHGNLGLLFLVTLALTVGGVNMGIFASAFARNELQVIQFIPLLLVPQVLLGGLFFPVATLPPVLKQIAYVLPLTYANFALQGVMLKGFGLPDVWPDLAALVAFAALMVVAAALSLRQERL